MKALLEAWGRAFGLAFGATLLIFAPDVIDVLGADAPNVQLALDLGYAALAASIAGGLNAVKELVPQFSWKLALGKWLSPAMTGRLDIFTWTFLGALIVSVTDILNAAPDLETWPALLASALAGALAFALRTVVGLGTKGETPAPETGLPE